MQVADTHGGGKKRKRKEQVADEKASAANGEPRKRKSKRLDREKVHAVDDDDDNDDQVADKDAQGSRIGQSDIDGQEKWAELSAYLSILEEGPLCPLNFDPDRPTKKHLHGDEDDGSVPMPHGPDGLRYHLMDIWLDELEKAMEFEDDQDAEVGENETKEVVNVSEPGSKPRKAKGDVPIDLLLRPIERLHKESAHKPVRLRAASVIGDQRLIEWGLREPPASEADEVADDEEWSGF